VFAECPFPQQGVAEVADIREGREGGWFGGVSLQRLVFQWVVVVQLGEP
jgi:hypothetical protein